MMFSRLTCKKHASCMYNGLVIVGFEAAQAQHWTGKGLGLNDVGLADFSTSKFLLSLVYLFVTTLSTYFYHSLRELLVSALIDGEF